MTPKEPNFYVLGLGSNFLPEQNLMQGRKALLSSYNTIRFSTVEETTPVGVKLKNVPNYWNQLAFLYTSDPLNEVIRIGKEIEKSVGRTKEKQLLGLVPLDIDVIGYEDQILKPEDWNRPDVQRALKELKEKENI